jgi:pimeloyl-ACP methyl ester carboxylesterase
LKNVADTEAYTAFDHVFSKTVRSLSRVIGLRRITQPFWGRWRASGVDDRIIFQFLDRVGTIDNWASAASGIIAEQVDAIETLRSREQFSHGALVKALRDLSYLCHMAQWGSLPLNDERRQLYRMARDYYVEAETLAFGNRYARINIPWKGQVLFGNFHKQQSSAPLIVIIHGMDGCKEEHLATELALYECGFSTLCFDGPGQGEALMLSGILWDENFHNSISAAIDVATEAGSADISSVGVSNVGVLGISVGGMWALRCAADDPRIAAVFDLGGPIHTRRFPSFPFLIKTRICQMTGARRQKDLEIVLAKNNLESDNVLGKINTHVRIVHGDRDRVVSIADKTWLLEKLQAAAKLRQDPPSEVSLRIIDSGDHCCTGHADVVRQDLIAFFTRTLLASGRVTAAH